MNLFRKGFLLKTVTRVCSKEIFDREKLFINPQINNLLQKLIDRDPIKVHKSGLRKRENPNIHLLSNEHHKNLEEKNASLTKQKLQMPPVKNCRTENVEILENNEGLRRFLPEGHKLVCVDLSIGDKRRERLMVVREADGVLRTAKEEERDRYNQVFFPLPGRDIIAPPLFNTENLEAILNEGRYVYILDRNCIQFEPDDPSFISICHKVYNHINKNCDKLKGFRQLSTTRHFGGLILHLVLENDIGNLLLEFLSTERLEAVSDLLRLHSIIYRKSNFATFLKEYENNNNLGVVEKLERFLQDSPISERQRKQINFLLECQRELKNMKNDQSN